MVKTQFLDAEKVKIQLPDAEIVKMLLSNVEMVNSLCWKLPHSETSKINFRIQKWLISDAEIVQTKFLDADMVNT